jgi:nucleoside-diphosphate-sugar epimerase
MSYSSPKISPISHLQVPAIPNGSTVLVVTGANGYIAAHKYLQFGFKVRGTVLGSQNSSWLISLFKKKYDDDRFEFALVPNIAHGGAFNEAVKGWKLTLLCSSLPRLILGVSAVVHAATMMNFDPNPDNSVPSVVAAAFGAMKAAAKERKVKRFVFTSSSAAGVSPFAGNDAVLDEHTWNGTAVEETYKSSTDDPTEHGTPTLLVRRGLTRLCGNGAA